MKYTKEQKELILKELYTFHRFGIKPGLNRTQLLLEHFDNPHSKLKYIHIAGTNGKGSVCSMLASILKESAYKVGLYTSPHLIEFNERIRVNGVKVSDDEMLPILVELLPVAKELGCTFFEITTVLAFIYFAKCKVDFAVIETGMGGRYDSTNIVYPLVSIITQIDMEHQEYLGDTLEKIAFEKAGIIKPDSPVVISDTHKELKEVFVKYAEEVGSPIFFTEDWYNVTNVRYSPDLSMQLNISDGFKTYSDLQIERGGNHQINNLKSVLSVIHYLSKKYKIPDTAVYFGLKNIKQNTGLFGRVEVISETPMIILDVSHNPASVKVLVDILDNTAINQSLFTVVFGVMADKDIGEILSSLKQYTEKLIITHPKTERAGATDYIEKIALKNNFKDIELIPDVDKAVERALSFTGKQTLIVGSFYTAGEAITYLKSINLISGDII
jgi:dihydrofolate synthase / folylpolyglutamate synthase